MRYFHLNLTVLVALWASEMSEVRSVTIMGIGDWELGIDMGRDVPMSVSEALMVDERRRRERRRAS